MARSCSSVESGPVPAKNWPTSHFQRRRYSRRMGTASAPVISVTVNGLHLLAEAQLAAAGDADVAAPTP